MKEVDEERERERETEGVCSYIYIFLKMTNVTIEKRSTKSFVQPLRHSHSTAFERVYTFRAVPSRTF